MTKTVRGYCLGDSLGGILELEPMPEDDRVALRRVGPELLLLFPWGPRLDMADLDPQGVLDHHQPA